MCALEGKMPGAAVGVVCEVDIGDGGEFGAGVAGEGMKGQTVCYYGEDLRKLGQRYCKVGMAHT